MKYEEVKLCKKNVEEDTVAGSDCSYANSPPLQMSFSFFLLKKL